jgi:hypothetical protein
MDREELSKVLSQPMQPQMVPHLVGILKSNNIGVEYLFELSLNGKKEISFRAAWMLEYLMVNKPQEFLIHLPKLFYALPLVKNQSVIRHYSKMVSLLTDKKVNPIYLSPVAVIDFNPVIELFFSWLLDEYTLVATKVHCMQTLANLSMRFQWIGNELLPTIAYLEPKESIAFFARAKVIKKTLLKQSQSA